MNELGEFVSVGSTMGGVGSLLVACWLVCVGWGGLRCGLSWSLGQGVGVALKGVDISVNDRWCQF